MNKGRLVLNLLVVWGLTGIWHGANWTFVVWGLFYFALLTFEKLSGFPQRLTRMWQRFLYRVLTLLAVMGGWVVFRSGSIREAYRYIKVMFGFGKRGLHDERTIFYLGEFWIFWIAGILLCIPLKGYLNRWLERHKRAAFVAETVKPFFLFSLFFVAITYLIVSDYNPFIYFNF